MDIRICSSMNATGDGSTLPKRKRRWFQFSVRALLVLTAGCAVVLAVWRAHVRPYYEQQRAIAALTKLRGRSVITTAPARPAWLGKVVGEEYFVRVVEVKFRGSITDEDLQHLKGLVGLQTLDLWGTPVRGEGLARLKGLKDLQNLYLWNARITDAGLEHLEGLSSLRSIDCWGTRISDAGLEHLTGLRKLETLYLWETDVTDAGVADLQEALPDVVIYRGALTHGETEH
jgi:hypothetical protein